MVLDASAILALLNKEPGHELVEKALPHSTLSTVNFSEIITVLDHFSMPISQAQEITLELINELLPFDHKQALIAASLRKETKQYGLSLGDRACLALAKVLQSPVLTADKAWKKLDVGVDVQLIR